jgi:hypothetical protein
VTPDRLQCNACGKLWKAFGSACRGARCGIRLAAEVWCVGTLYEIQAPKAQLSLEEVVYWLVVSRQGSMHAMHAIAERDTAELRWIIHSHVVTARHAKHDTELGRRYACSARLLVEALRRIQEEQRSRRARAQQMKG